ncbi:MAG: hypothetical protein JEZ08_04145 [Clostridiales bacterium]|nr:hypothetical protein [Clostridiales bacterium]
MKKLKSYIGLSTIKSPLFSEQAFEALDELIFEDNNHPNKNQLITTKPFVGHKITEGYDIRGNTQFISLVQPHFHIQITDNYDDTTIDIETYCSKGLDNFLRVGFGFFLVLFLLSFIGFLTMGFFAIFFIVVMLEYLAAYLLVFHLLKFYLHKEYKTGISIIQDHLNKEH